VQLRAAVVRFTLQRWSFDRQCPAAVERDKAENQKCERPLSTHPTVVKILF
jgi:hypothetical protein